MFALNLYQYAANNPVNFVDHSGYLPVLDIEGDIVEFPSGNIINKKTGEKLHEPAITSGEVITNTVTSVADASLGHMIGNLYQKVSFKTLGPVPLGGGAISITLQTAVTDKPWLPLAKGVMKYTGGVVATGLFAYGVYDNFNNYQHPWIRTAVDIAALGLV